MESEHISVDTWMVGWGRHDGDARHSVGHGSKLVGETDSPRMGSSTTVLDL